MKKHRISYNPEVCIDSAIRLSQLRVGKVSKAISNVEGRIVTEVNVYSSADNVRENETVRLLLCDNGNVVWTDAPQNIERYPL